MKKRSVQLNRKQKEAIGELLKQERLTSGIPASVVAKKLNMCQRHIFNMERGHFSICSLRCYATFLGIDWVHIEELIYLNK